RQVASGAYLRQTRRGVAYRGRRHRPGTRHVALTRWVRPTLGVVRRHPELIAAANACHSPGASTNTGLWASLLSRSPTWAVLKLTSTQLPPLGSLAKAFCHDAGLNCPATGSPASALPPAHSVMNEPPHLLTESAP